MSDVSVGLVITWRDSYVPAVIQACFVPRVGEIVSVEMMRKEQTKDPVFGEWYFKKEMITGVVKSVSHTFDPVWRESNKNIQTIDIVLED